MFSHILSPNNHIKSKTEKLKTKVILTGSRSPNNKLVRYDQTVICLFYRHLVCYSLKVSEHLMDLNTKNVVRIWKSTWNLFQIILKYVYCCAVVVLLYCMCIVCVLYCCCIVVLYCIVLYVYCIIYSCT